MPFKKLRLYPEAIEKPISEPKAEHPEILRITQEKKEPVIVAQVSQDDPASGWKQILLDGDPITISDITKVATSKYLPPTALATGGTATIWTPAAGKAIRAKRIQVSVDAATRIDFRWGTTAFESYYLPANGSVVVNLVGSNEQPATDTALTILSSAAANVTAKASGDEV